MELSVSCYTSLSAYPLQAPLTMDFPLRTTEIAPGKCAKRDCFALGGEIVSLVATSDSDSTDCHVTLGLVSTQMQMSGISRSRVDENGQTALTEV